MKIRIMGTAEECRDFVKMVKKSVPGSYIRTISNFCPNRRETYSNEGRVYIEIDRPQLERTGHELPKGKR